MLMTTLHAANARAQVAPNGRRHLVRVIRIHALVAEEWLYKGPGQASNRELHTRIVSTIQDGLHCLTAVVEIFRHHFILCSEQTQPGGSSASEPGTKDGAPKAYGASIRPPVLIV